MDDPTTMGSGPGDRYRAARDAAPADGPTVGWVMRASDADLMLHAQVVWQQLNKRGLTEPRTAEAQEWVDTHLNVVEALETAQAELADREDLMEMAQQEMDRLRGLNKRLRAELAETRAAGDELAVATYAMTMQLRRHLSGEAGHLLVDAERATEGWRSVRGDAPGAGVGRGAAVNVCDGSPGSPGVERVGDDKFVCTGCPVCAPRPRRRSR